VCSPLESAASLNFNMKTRRDAILEHLRKYTLSSKQISEMSDLEYDLHCRECENDMKEINESYDNRATPS
jgi:hypothetical protein